MPTLFDDDLTLDSVKKLLANTDTDLAAKNQNGKTAIQILAGKKRWDLVAEFTNYPLEPNSEDNEGYGCALLHAVQDNQVELAKRLLTANASCNWQFGESNLVHIAVNTRNEELLKLILEKSANIRRKNEKQVTPILLAAQQNSWTMVSELASAWGQTDRNDNLQYAEVILLAKVAGQPQIIEQLIGLSEQASWRVKTGNLFQLNLLHLAVLRENQAAVKYELEQSLDGLQGKNEAKRTPISAAAYGNQWDIVSCIADYKTDKKDKAEYGDALLLAVKANQLEIAEKLIKAGASLGWRTSTKNTLVHSAVLTKNEALLKVILGTSAKKNKKNKEKITPILLAAQQGSWTMVIDLANALGQTDKNDSFQYAEIINLAKEAKQEEVIVQLTALSNPSLFDDDLTEESLQILLANPYIDITKTNKDKVTAVQKLAMGKKWNLVEKFITTKPPVSPDKARYGSALLRAVEAGEIELSKRLIKAGVSTTWYFDNTGNNLVHLAVNSGNIELLNVVLETSADKNRKNNKEDTPILQAASNNQWDMVSALAKSMGQTDANDTFQYDKVILLAYGGHKKQDIIDQLTKLSENTNWKIEERAMIAKAKEEEQFVAAFTKIYTALYKGQSSVFKSNSFLAKNPHPSKESILSYADDHKDSRTAVASKLVNQYKDNLKSPDLFKAIHDYCFKHSSSFGFFKRSQNKAGLLQANDFEKTVNEASDNSRTGTIRNALR